MDCGPTCIRTVSAFYGNQLNQQDLLEKCKVGPYGASLYDLEECAKHFGFDTLSSRLTYTQLKDYIPLPCIAYLNSNHFVVIFKIEGDTLIIGDPAKGIAHYPREQFKKRWIETGKEDGIVLAITPNADFHKYSTRTNTQNGFGIGYIYSHLKANWKDLVRLSIFLLAGTVLQLIFPLLTQGIVDKGIQKKDLNFIYVILLAQLSLVLGRTIIDFGKSWILLHISNRINISIISNFLDNLMRLAIPFFDQRSTGDILRRMDDHSRVERFLSGTSFRVIFALINLAVYSFLIATYSVSVLLAFFVGSSMYMIYIQQFMKRRKRLDYMKFGELARTESGVIELIDGIRDIKLNNSQGRMTSSWRTSQLKLFNLSTSFTKLQQLQDGGGTMINEIRNVVITFLAAQAVIDGSMTLGMMLAMQYIIGQLHSPIGEFINFSREYQEAKIGFERIDTVHRLEKEHHFENDKVSNIKPLHSKLELIDVDFYYGQSNAKLVLENINICFPVGQVTAIVGESGSGKTTLLSLLLKFYKPTKGLIQIDGNALATINTDLWRDRCGVVMQNGYIFSDTIARNIALSSDDIDQGRLDEAIRISNLQGLLKDIPDGANAIVGREGQGLSVGQKQRILIARAVYKNPDIFLFDEATSALDATNERVIMKNLMETLKGKTAIIVAHRLSTVVNADNILVLERGKIKEQGTHKDLVALKGAYYNLIKDQLELGT